ncbi:MAG: alpha/beta hydrolase [Crocosphaera sp.]|nr:alpha/beta hydrolase [Crocosphaera sp.]
MFSWLKSCKYVLLAVLSSVFSSSPTVAAEKIQIVLESLNLTLRVESLEKFADEGIINQDLAFYLKRANLDENGQDLLREILSTQYPIDGVQLATFLNTPTGELLLNRIGVLISVPGGRNGKYLLRGALIQAALDTQEGLTLINILNHLATDVQLNVSQIKQALDYQQRLILATNSLTQDAMILSNQKAAEINHDYSALKDIREKGNYGVNPVRVIKLTDPNRQRTFDLHLYQPQRWKAGKTPVVVVSHGLGSHPDDFKELGQQLASYGFLVAIPQHIGSDKEKLESMLNNYSRQLYDLEDFINRPLDISYVLDDLERRNETEFSNRLNLDKVGVLGHSFGGYTALALAGATWDFDNIRTYCDRPVWEFNLSMLLQCQTLNLPQQLYNFRDPRVAAIGIMNPVNSVVFGSQGLEKVDIPIIIGAGTNDPATPAIIEQIRTFAWVSSQNKYLFVMEGQAHFLNTPDANSQVNQLVSLLVNFQEVEPNLFTLYGNTQATAFLQFYLAGEDSYKVYLEPSYWQSISDPSYPIYWLDRSAVTTLINTYNRFKPKEIPTLFPN